MFRSLFYDHLEGLSFILSASTTLRLQPKGGRCTKYEGQPLKMVIEEGLKHVGFFNDAFTEYF
jgi:hypothetical protein